MSPPALRTRRHTRRPNRKFLDQPARIRALLPESPPRAADEVRSHPEPAPRQARVEGIPKSGPESVQIWVFSGDADHAQFCFPFPCNTTSTHENQILQLPPSLQSANRHRSSGSRMPPSGSPARPGCATSRPSRGWAPIESSPNSPVHGAPRPDRSTFSTSVTCFPLRQSSIGMCSKTARPGRLGSFESAPDLRAEPMPSQRFSFAGPDHRKATPDGFWKRRRDRLLHRSGRGQAHCDFRSARTLGFFRDATRIRDEIRLRP